MLAPWLGEHTIIILKLKLQWGEDALFLGPSLALHSRLTALYLIQFA
jgi:hypothetical protein